MFPHHIFSTTKNILHLVWTKVRFLFLAQSFLLVIGSLFQFLAPAILGYLINNISSANTHTLTTFAILYLLANIAPTFIYSLQITANKLLYLNIDQFTQLEMIKLHANLDVPSHEDPDLKDTITKVTEDGNWRIVNFAERIVFIAEGILSLTIATIILGRINLLSIIILIIATIPEFIVANRYGRDVWTIASANSTSRRKFWDLRHHFTYLPYLIELKLNQAIDHLLSQITKIYNQFLTSQQTNETKRLTKTLITQTISQIALGSIIFYYFTLTFSKSLEIGTLTFVLTTLYSFRSQLSGLFYSLSAQYQDSLFVKDFFMLINLPPKLTPPKNPVLIDPQTTPTIEFHHVSFTYPHTNQPVLQNISFKLEPGQKLALVGQNGAGKTTLVKLLCRFYDPTSGYITINGHDLKDIDLPSWYHHLGLLYQEYANYHLKVKNAISVSRPLFNPKFSQIKTAAVQAGAHQFISQYDNKYSQQLGKDFDQGIEPSIGQWQKLALARLFFRNPHIFILDEPTASLDAKAEANIFNQLEKLSTTSSTILISHRFSSVKTADTILVIDNGIIIEQGSHTQLIALDGVYKELYNLQAKSYL